MTTAKLLIKQLVKKFRNTNKMSKVKEEMGNLMKELNNNLEADKRYWVRNDAKLRAVVSSKSYDEFRDIVEAAHLKALSKEDKSRKNQNSWNKAI